MIQNIPIEKLQPHPKNPRKDLGELWELSESIKAQGILQNLTVVPTEKGYCASCARGDGSTEGAGYNCKYLKDISGPPPCPNWEDGNYYTVVIGHRRLAAAKAAGLKEVPCAIAEMDEKTQISTMLLENIQRSDLTVYEQAQGFQMMLDLGESIGSVAEATGFSEKTIRRRVDLLDLDAKKFKESCERGATLEDYARLSQLKDPENRNKALETIGTNNFQMTLSNLFAAEVRYEKKKQYLDMLRTFAEELKPEERAAGDYCQLRWYSYHSENVNVEVPEDHETVKYYYMVGSHDITIYITREEYNRRREAEPKAEATEDDIIRQSIYERNNNRKKMLDEKSKAAYELRKEFVLSVPKTAAKKMFADIAAMLLCSFNNMTLTTMNDEDVENIIDSIIPDDDETPAVDFVRECVTENPEAAVLRYVFVCNDGVNNSYASWDGGHQDNYELDDMYAFLEKLGYEMSDEEKQLQDGTHPLFEKIVASEAENCILCKGANPQCGKCCKVCKKKCNGQQRCRNEAE